MSKFIVAALAAGAVLASGGAVIAQQSPQEAAAGEAAKDGQNLPPVVVQQKKPAGDAAVKPAAKKPVADDGPQPKQRKKVVSKPKAAPDAAPAPAPETSGSAAQAAGSPATALGTYNPALDLPGLKLPPGTTLTTAGPVQGYRALSAMSSTKTATPIEQIPQSIQVVPKSLLKDQSTTSISEALQNVSNVQGADARSLGNDALNVGVHKIRGFNAEQWLDGLMVMNNAGDLSAFANVERIEVLKGPSAILYGGGAGAPIGGAVNVVSKLPTDRPSAEAGVKFGSHGFVQPYFDINQPLSPNVLFRMTAEYTSTKDFVDVLDQDRYTIAPTLTFTNKTDTSLTLQARVSNVMQQTYQGLPATGTVAGDFRIDPHLFIGPSDIERSHSLSKSITVSLDHKFNDYLSGNVKARWSKSSTDQNTQVLVNGDFTGATPVFPPSTWLLSNSELAQEQDEKAVAANLQAKFNFGQSRNVVLAGGDYARAHNAGTFTIDYLGNAACIYFFECTPSLFGTPPLVFVDLQSPFFGVPYRRPSLAGQTVDTTSVTAQLFGGALGQFQQFNDIHDKFTTQGAYLQVQSSGYERVHLLAGARLANVNIEHTDNISAPGRSTYTDTTKLLPRAGIVVDVLPWLSPYASYSEGMKATSSINLNEPQKPEESVQKEVGVKLHFNNQLTGTFAAFEIEHTNIPIISSFLVSRLSDQISRGYEADIIWQPNFNWQVLASYGHTDVTFASNGPRSIPAGAKVPGVPEDSGRLWVNYRFDQPMLMGLSVGAGVYVASIQYVDEYNVFKTPRYHTVDARIGYDTKNFSASFNVKNLTNEHYFTPYYFLGGQVAPSDDRAFYGTLAYKY